MNISNPALIRLALRLWTFRMRVWDAAPPVLFPDTHQVWRLKEAETADTLTAVAKAYVAVFLEKPWEENYAPCWVMDKLQRELNNTASLLVILKGNETWPVAGFCWGVVAAPDEIYQRVLVARSMGDNETAKEKLAHLLLNGSLRLDSGLLFVDEVAVLRQFRGGLSPIQFLIRPVFEMGYKKGARQALFWTVRHSPIYPLALGMGFESVGQVDGIEYLFHPNFIPLLKVLQNVEPENIRKILSITSGSSLRKTFTSLKRKLLKKFLEIKSQKNLIPKSR